MRRMLVALSVTVFFSTAGFAGPFEKGIEAYKKQNYEEAAQYWFPIAMQGDPRAENNIGVLFEKGWGIPQDYEKAARWYRRAAEQDHHWAKQNLADLVERGLIGNSNAAPVEGLPPQPVATAQTDQEAIAETAEGPVGPSLPD